MDEEVYTLQTPGRESKAIETTTPEYGTSFQATTPFDSSEYTTSINQLIAEPDRPTPTQYFLATLYKLSDYLFRKQINARMPDDMQLSFDDYLNSVSDEISVYDNLHRKAKKDALIAKLTKGQQNQYESQLMQCYDRVPYLYFENNFILDFGDLRKNPKQMRQKQQKLNDDLDLVEINLFSQIHFKFHEYFKVVANFDYLSQSLVININKVKEARARANKVKVDFLDKSINLRKKIAHRQNLEKSIKFLKIIKSLKKLPDIINEILGSSLPYECLSLLKSTKDSLGQTSGLKCLQKISQGIKQNESLVQMGLNKRYADQLYLYLQECQTVNLQENWDRINSHGCMDQSMNASYISNSNNTILEESFIDMQPSCSKNKRNEGRQYQIAMILLQSYRFINFPVDLVRIKISNSLRVFSKRFDQELANCLKQVLQLKKQKYHQHNEQILALDDPQPPINNLGEKKQSEEEQGLTEQLVQKVTVSFYIKHLFIFNEIMKDTMDRFLGYLQTLLHEYNESVVKDQAKFFEIFREQLTILPSICKIIKQKVSSFLSFKNINGVTLPDFKQWLGLLEYWQKYIDNLIDQHPLINSQWNIQGLEDVISDTVRKMMQAMNLKGTINQSCLNFITSTHTNVVSCELPQAFADQGWQNAQVPIQFVEVLNNVAQWQTPHQQINQNISITILNDSTDKGLLGSKDSVLNRSTLSQDGQKKPMIHNKFRVLKNNILVQGNRYKITISFILLVQFLQEYVKIGRTLKSSQKYLYERMFDLVDTYNSRTKELILDAKARQYQKMKAKNISAKHLCLLHNCLSILVKLLEELRYEEVKELKEISIQSIRLHAQKIIQKLSKLLYGKVQQTIHGFLISISELKTIQEQIQKVEKTNSSLLTVFVQMMGIIDQFLILEDRKLVFKDSIHIFVTKYFKELLLKGKAILSENKILLQKMRFLRQYFPQELSVMDKQLQRMEKQ